MRYDVDTDALRDDAASVGEVLARVQRLRIGDELRPLGGAIPGGRVAGGLGRVAAAWEARLAGTRWELRELGRCLAAAADTYDAVEQASRQALRSSSSGGTP
ncbi:hypothetical protein ASE25_20265 [Terrabacter sp. Root85]|uniref:hypothetical protein n=1 Tax=Terrabacter sp. Root85 TaxID=1736603 RepID=UPI0006F6D481|nr:hypothetical protein [Terrabacter sp. Root85]KRC85360.1 hypothetical protein ASE25_20265 [Terrabacter sp. Root85]